MAAVASQNLSNALVAFSLDGRFPDEISQLPPVADTDLGPAIEALDKTKDKLETELHTINEEIKEDVSSWVKNAKTLQEDILRSKTIAHEIIRQSKAPDVSGEDIQDAEDKVEFLQREVQYSQQLHGVLGRIKNANELLSQVEAAKDERRILDSLHLLEKSWAAIDTIGVSKSCRVMRLLNVRSFELKSGVHEVFDHVWKALVHIDIEAGNIAIYDSLSDEPMSLSEAVIGLKAYKEVDERMEQLWRNVDAAVVSPRMNPNKPSLPQVSISKEVLELKGSSERSVELLLVDLEKVLAFLANRLPSDLLQSLGNFMMMDIIPRLINDWLDSSVPSSLQEMDTFQAMIQHAREFCDSLENHGYTGFQELSDWVNNAPSIWLGKCRERTLDSVRRKLFNGLGKSKQVEKVERQMVSIEEGRELSKKSGATAASADNNDWGADWGDAWDDDKGGEDEPEPQHQGQTHDAPTGDDDGTDAWGWDEEDAAQPAGEPGNPKKEEDDEDDSAAAWGWGEEADADEPEPIKSPKKAHKGASQPRELVLRETYSISSMPEPVLELVYAILEDAAALTRESDEYTTVAATAPGLFNLPTFALALFRAISPYYYSLSDGGNMFLYNDTKYLAEKLSEFSTSWKEREDLTPRARNMLRLDNDIKALESFANRSYANEMGLQKTVLRDLLGGLQSIMTQDETEACIDMGVARIRAMATTWEPILARSVWTQAIGSLVDTLAAKLIADVIDMDSIGQDEAYNIATLISKATELDDLFLPSKIIPGTAPSPDEIPQTAQYAPNWLRLKYLSEILQSNLNEVKYLWGESELSLYFTAEEVVDLIQASFEANVRTKETIRSIQNNPRPLEGKP